MSRRACPAAAAVLFCAALACVSALATARDDRRNTGTAAPAVSRLPVSVTEPVSYDLTFAPAFDGADSTFDGQAKIVIRVLSNSNTVTLNLNDLTVTNVTVTDVKTGRNVATVGNVTYRPADEQMEIHTARSLLANRLYEVNILYGGRIRNDMSGLYMSSYQTGNETRWLAVTQFEPVYARRAFPCYDEPAYKAVFNISVVKKKNQIALSNMPISFVENGSNDTELVHFKTTPPMSTYLAAIFVGDFVTNQDGSNMNVYTHVDFVNQTKYVQTEAEKHLNVLSVYTGIEYMLPKMDLLAIPDFKAGAMENWGLNTYRESYLLLHDESKSKMKIRASEVVQHEFTHQWFGDLVTCEWWDYLWLNEGFARYFQYFATGMARTSWPVEEQFVTEAHQGALAYDQTPRHPITSSVNTPSEIEDIFDTITYSKAASVLRMLKHFVTEKVFQTSLQQYLEQYRENVANANNLYSSFDSVTMELDVNIGGFTVNEIMSSWTLQSGYPVLEITKNSTSNTFSVIQKRFLISGNTTEKATWIIGLTFTTEKDKNFTETKPSLWTDKTSNLTTVPAPENSGWYIFNIQSTGFYRVNYDVDNWMALIKQLNNTPTDIHVLNRAQLISDSFNLARAGQLDYTVALELTKYLKNENSSTPWYSAMDGFSYLLQRMPRSEKGYKNLKAYVSNLAGNIFKKLDARVDGGNSEFFVKSAYDDFSSWACGLENKYCTKKALERFNQWRSGIKISPDIKDAAFCAGVKTSTYPDTTFYDMFKLYTTTTSISEKMSAQSALGCSTNRTELKEYLDHILDGPHGPIKEKDYLSVISSISVTPLGLDVLHEFLSNNLNKTLYGLTDGHKVAKHIYSTLASKFTNDVDIEKIKNLKNDSSIPDSVRQSFEESFGKINDHLLWFDKYSDIIDKWTLENQDFEEPETTTTTTTTTTTQATTTTIYTTTLSPGDRSSSTTTTPKPSSATSNLQNSLTILQFTVITLLVKTYIL